MSDLVELSRRVSEAEGPSRELDAEVYIALEIPAPRVGRIDRMGGVVGWHPIDAPYQSSIEVPRYTASLDAVAALIAEKIPVHEGVCLHEKLDFSYADIWLVGPLQKIGTIRAKTPALALLAAALLAIHERNKSDE